MEEHSSEHTKFLNNTLYNKFIHYNDITYSEVLIQKWQRISIAASPHANGLSYSLSNKDSISLTSFLAFLNNPNLCDVQIGPTRPHAKTLL